MRSMLTLVVSALLVLGSVAEAVIIADWEFSEGSGATANSSVGGWTGTLTSFPNTNPGVGSTPGTPGWASGGRLNFNSAARVSTNFPLSTLYNSSFTLEMVGTHNNLAQTWSPIFGQDTGIANILFFGKTSGQNRVHRNIAGLGAGVDSNVVTLADGRPHQFALTFDDAANTMNFYIDHALAGTIGGVVGVMSSATNLWLGSVGHNPGAEYWNGYMDRARIASHVMARSEFQRLPIANWSFNEGSGSTAGDSLSGYSGTLVNFPSTAPGVGDPVGVPGWTSNGRLNLNNAARVETNLPLSRLIARSFTIEAFASHNNGAQTWSPLFGQSNPANIFFFGKTGGQQSLHYNIIGLGSFTTSVVAGLADGLEHHFALVFDDDANTMTFYFDYKQVGLVTGVTGTMGDPGNLWIGGVSHQPLNEYWNGYLSEMRLTLGALGRTELLGFPEPGTLTLFALGGLGILRRRRHARRA